MYIITEQCNSYVDALYKLEDGTPNDRAKHSRLECCQRGPPILYLQVECASRERE